MINKRNYKDLMIIDKSGKIVYSDVANPQHYGVERRTLIGMNLDDLYQNLSLEYPVRGALERGEAKEDFEVEVVTKKRNPSH